MKLWQYLLASYFPGDNVHRLTGPIGPITISLSLLIAIASLVHTRRNERRLEQEAEKALPGPLDASAPAGQATELLKGQSASGHDSDRQ